MVKLRFWIYLQSIYQNYFKIMIFTTKRANKNENKVFFCGK